MAALAKVAEQQQQAFQQQQQDPLFQQQQQELQLKAQEINNKFQVELMKIEAQKQIAGITSQTKLEQQSMKDTATHQMKAADLINERMFPQEANPQGQFPPGGNA